MLEVRKDTLNSNSGVIWHVWKFKRGGENILWCRCAFAMVRLQTDKPLVCILVSGILSG